MNRVILLGLTLVLGAGSGVCQAPALSGWTVIGPGGGGTTIGPMVSPLDPHLVVEHCDMTGGYITLNDGESWRMFNLRGGISTFAFDPSNVKVIYAGNAALWRSTNSGQTWQMIFPNPARNTIEHQLGDHADYSLTSDDKAYPGGDVSAIAVDPSDVKHLYVAFDNRGTPAVIVRSFDGGASWERLATLPDRVSAMTLYDGKLLAISGPAAYRVSLDGKTEKRGQITGPIHAVTIGRRGDSLWLYATNNAGQLFISDDAGDHWRQSTPELQQSSGRFEAVGASADHPEIAYVGFRDLQLPGGKEDLFNGIAGTQDGGKTWKILFQESTHAATNLKGTWIEERSTQNGFSIFFDSPYSLGVSPTDPRIVYATDLFRTYRTLDGGRTWQEMNSMRVHGDDWTTRGLNVTTNYGVQFDPFDLKHIFMDNTDIALFQSRDAGRAWHSSSSGVPEDWRNTTYWLAFDPAVRGKVWAAFSGVHDLPRPKMWRDRSTQQYTGGVGISTDGGEHWKPSGTGMPSTSVTDILLDPASPVGSRTLYATAFGRGVFKSTDDGKTWTLKNDGITNPQPFAWRISRDHHGTLYLVVARRSEGLHPDPAGNGALYRSVDGAEHWERMSLPPGVTGPTALEIDPRNPQRLYLTAWGREGINADSGGGVYASDDGGHSWHALFTDSQHVYDLTIDPHNPDVLYICGFDAAAYRSTDRGKHWNRIRGYNFKWGHRVIVDPANPANIYITTYGGGVWHGPANGGPGIHEDILSNVPVAH